MYKHAQYLVMLLVAALLGPHLAADLSAAEPRERIALNEEWYFRKGDPEGTGAALSYLINPAVKDAVIASASNNGLSDDQRNLGSAVAFTRADFDDKEWRQLDLPHDWGIEGPFDITLPGSTGKLPWSGVGWYRKHFTLPAADAGRKITVEIDGAMSCPMVWCNGRFVGGWVYGYSSFSLDVSPFLKPGAENVIAVRLENLPDSSRWYPGGGIYRNVWLTKTAPVHVAHWGTTVVTPDVSAERASVQVITKVVNEEEVPVEATLSTEVVPIDVVGRPSGPGTSLPAVTGTMAPGAHLSLTQSGEIAGPKLWDTQHPDRYSAITTVSLNGKTVDRVETPFGIRSIRFTVDNGFLLNGKRLNLQGVCNHHDLGALGAAFNLRAAERQFEILKAMGVNALRTSHNMPAPELLDLCDRMGIVVMDESFDCWAKGKTPNDYSRYWQDWHEKDLRALVRRDRNHPSVIMWSLGNEIREQGRPESVPMVEELVRIVHEEDSTRPATVGGNGLQNWDLQFGATYDVLGQNYGPGAYAAILKRFPSKPLFASETSSCVSSRGEYFFQTPEGVAALNDRLRKKEAERYAREVSKAQAEGKPAPAPKTYKPIAFTPISLSTHDGGMENFQVSSYDLYAPGWAQAPDDVFAALDRVPAVAGEFVWTGFDYLGEPTPFTSDRSVLLNFAYDPVKLAEYEKKLKGMDKVRCPSRSSYFGIVDLCGFPKDRFYLYQSRWRPELPMVHILPHWNWPERIGKVTPVHIYTSGDECELFLNGKSQGRKKKGPRNYRLCWDDAVYEPGVLKAVAYRNGTPWAEETVRTTGPAAKLTLEADRLVIANDGQDLSFVTVTVRDKEGLRVPRSHPEVTFTISGPGEIVATDNGDATDLTTFSDTKRKAFNGLALAIVRAKKGKSGPIVLKSSAVGLPPAEINLGTKPVVEQPFAPVIIERKPAPYEE